MTQIKNVYLAANELSDVLDDESVHLDVSLGVEAEAVDLGSAQVDDVAPVRLHAFVQRPFRSLR